ncbi:MAG: hypothetical protein QMC93_00810 [Patescibacteria group bacterium]|nr:hypothetical protein [Patescibacteria group bacterium]
MSKKVWIFLIILVVIIAGFFYFWYEWLPKELEKEETPEEKTQPPTLFGKEDYKIEERDGEKFIVVEKVGLTCQVPSGWRIEIEGSDYPESEYWVDLYSPDVEIFDILTKGCGINIKIGVAEEAVKGIKNNIKLIQEDPKKFKETEEKYEYEIVEIDNYQGLKWKLQENQKIAQFIQSSGIDIPIGDKKLLTLSTQFPPNYKEKCLPLWENFLKYVVIK